MRFPPPQSSEALPGVQERSDISRALAMCSGAINFLPTRVERALQTFVEGVTGTFVPSSFCCLFRQSLAGEKTASVGEARCQERMNGSGLTGAIRNYFLGPKRKGLKVLNPPHEE